MLIRADLLKKIRSVMQGPMINLNKLTQSPLLMISLALCSSASYSQNQKSESFIIHNKTAHIRSVDIKGKKTTAQNITIILSSENAGAAFSETPEGNNAKWDLIPPPQITDITVMNGFYSTLQKTNQNARSTSTFLSQVRYPIRLKVEISDQKLEVEIVEAGSWTIKIILDNIYNPDLFNTLVN